MAKANDLNDAVARGLTYLAKEQVADGSFKSFSSASTQPFKPVRSWQTTFVPALILAALTGLEQPAAVSIRNKLAKFLVGQKSAHWSFNYWAKSAPEYKTQAYPDDLDDTFCALAALYLHDPSVIDARVLATTVKLLLATETAVGGPYRTWLVPTDSQPIWLDVDVAVNSNIAYFLLLTGSHLPSVNKMIGKAIATNSFSSPYYPLEYAFIYYFSRSYRGPQQTKLLRRVRRLHKAAHTDLDRALCLTARVRLGDKQDLGGAVQELLKGQQLDGSWPAAAFYADPVKDGKLYYNGGPALTTAFVLEALQLVGQKNGVIGTPTMGDGDLRLKKSVLSRARRQSGELDPTLKRAVLRSLRQVADSSNGNEIIALAESFQKSLINPPENSPSDFIIKLGLANLYGWLAYTIYDDFIDEEGKPDLVSIANVALRRSLEGFSESLPTNPNFRSFVRATFDTIDSANAWELEHCRFTAQDGILNITKLPDYGNNAKLAERSVGHVLPVMAVLAASGVQPDTPGGRQIQLAFQHYLIARQLNDDAHDWPDDLQRGHITPVVAQILSDLGATGGKYPLETLLPEARRKFWQSTLPKICKSMQRHVQLGRRALHKSHLCKADNILAKLLDGIDVSVANTLSQQAQARDFLRQYKQESKVGVK